MGGYVCSLFISVVLPLFSSSQLMLILETTEGWAVSLVEKPSITLLSCDLHSKLTHQTFNIPTYIFSAFFFRDFVRPRLVTYLQSCALAQWLTIYRRQWYQYFEQEEILENPCIYHTFSKFMRRYSAGMVGGWEWHDKETPLLPTNIFNQSWSIFIGFILGTSSKILLWEMIP